jgi:type I restriction enzyme S subunit
LSITGHLVANCRGATIQGLTRDFIHALEIPLPPIPEQKRIAAILNDQMEAVERARAAAEAQLEAAKALPAAYLRAVFSSPEAQQWPRQPLGEVANLERGKFSPRPRNDPRYYSGPYPWIQTGEVEAAQKYITCYRSTLNELGLGVSKMFPKGTLVITIAATIGAVGILTFDSCMPDSLVGITPRTGMSDTEFLYYVLLFVRGHLKSLAPQMAQPNLKLELLNPLMVPVPPLPDQQRIAAMVNEQMASAERARKAIEEELDTINKLPAALLRRAFNGEL